MSEGGDGSSLFPFSPSLNGLDVKCLLFKVRREVEGRKNTHSRAHAHMHTVFLSLIISLYVLSHSFRGQRGNRGDLRTGRGKTLRDEE